MIKWLFERLTGQPWTTVRSGTAEFGLPLSAMYGAELGRYTDAQLYAYGDQIVARLRERRQHALRQCAAV